MNHISEALDKNLRPDPAMPLAIRRYSEPDKPAWDQFVQGAKNQVFLFYRNYMDYHADRFTDHSLLIYENDALIGLLPANQDGDVLISHAGLTFGSILTNNTMNTPLMLSVFEALQNYLASKGITRLRYKAIPHIYHGYPAEEDLYALFRMNAPLVRRDVSATVWMAEPYGFNQLRKRCVKKAKQAGLMVTQSTDFVGYIDIVKARLKERYDAEPVHTAEELLSLAQAFPGNIKLFTASQSGQMQAGIVIYENPIVAHVQYIASSPEGLNAGAVDLIAAHLIENEYSQKRYFDFGISTEENGRVLNEGLIRQKEMFGARATVYDTYELSL